ncbi:LuxR family transcriptional regulator [Bradyrhizobium sp. WSM2254]|uniref:LuxR family transcriptional regulator n=1 Tax=Bradyrhizobium sp. WSM2254 TaxID=1188263 RepID=UPI0006766E6B|nr:LuxR family transcriptional regulator [Bradyrhizobium sp. WSM2254]
MRYVFQAFIDQLIESTDVDDLRLGMAETAAALDLCCFAYLALPSRPDAQPLLISTYPSSWTSHYVQQQYHRFDPVIIQSLRRDKAFEWGLGLGPEVHSEPARQLFEEAARFGIRCGFTVPIHESGVAVATVTFAANERAASFGRSLRRHARILPFMATVFHAHAQRKLRACDQIDGVSLSRREIECLNWAAQGKSSWEIGRIMGISHHTVAFHLDNARTKLGVRSTIQAVARFVAAGRKT